MTKHSKKFNSWEREGIIGYVICHLPSFERELINYIAQSFDWAEEGSIIKIKWQLKKSFNYGWLRDSREHLFYVPRPLIKDTFKLFEKAEREYLDDTRVL